MSQHLGFCWNDHGDRRQFMAGLADAVVRQIQEKGGTVASYQLLIGQMRAVEYLLDGMPICEDCQSTVTEARLTSANEVH